MAPIVDLTMSSSDDEKPAASKEKSNPLRSSVKRRTSDDTPSASSTGKKPRKDDVKQPKTTATASKATSSSSGASKGGANSSLKQTKSSPDAKSKSSTSNATTEAKPKPKWQPHVRTGPTDPGSKIVPEGADNCLEGLTFVFTGELQSLSRDEAQDLAKRYNGRVTGAPSSKTSFVVVGEGAGPKKLETIRKLKLKTLDEDGFLDLIATRPGPKLTEADIKKKEKEEQKFKEDTKALAEQTTTKDTGPSSELWTVKYAPKSVNDICGNKQEVEKLMQWLKDWPKSLKSNFKKPGPHGINIYRAVLISGPPGIGKTTSAHLAAKLTGYNAVELNASDTRSKKLLETSLKSTIDQTSLDKWYHGKESEPTDPILAENANKLVLIMDEVDGMSAGDRGGVGALNALIKKTKIPIIAVANDRSLPKMKPLQFTTYNMNFRKPDAKMIRSRILKIAHIEKMNIPPNVIDQLINGVRSDIRQVINLLSTWKFGSNTMTFDEGKKLTSLQDKISLQTPFTLLDRLFGPYAWSATNKDTLNSKLEVFFQDFSAMPLFVQENYAKHQFARAGSDNSPEGQAKRLGLLTKAATSISDGDIMGRMVQNAQHWSLLPAFGFASTIKPSYLTYGTGPQSWSQGGVNARAFPAWFGKNSTQTRLERCLRDIQVRMRPHVSGDKREIRQAYLPSLYPRMVHPLLGSSDKTESITQVIELMDEYYLSKDEWDSMSELLITDEPDGRKPEEVLKSITTKTKTAFTRKYNTTSHPIPFHSGDATAGAARKIEEPTPDFEDVMDVGDEIVDEEESPEDNTNINSVSKDKLVKEKKQTASNKGKATESKTKQASKKTK